MRLSGLSQPIRHLALLLALAWFVALPLRDVLAFPERISVLPNLETDAAAYDAFARELARSWNFATLPEKHPPGWIVVLATVYSAFGDSYVAGKIISWVALVVTVGLCAWLANRVYGRTAGAIAALLCASAPGLRAYVGTLQYEVLTAALFTLFILLSVRAAEAATARSALIRAVIAGLAGGALVVTRETFVLVVPIAALWVWMRRRADPATQAARRHALISALVIVGVAAAPALAWSLVQSVQNERIILVADKAREVFDAGNNPRANGTYNEPLAGIGEPAGLDFVRAFPARAIELAARKALYSFGILRDGWNVPHPPAVWLWRATTGVVPLALIEPFVRGGWLLAALAAAIYMLGRDGVRKWWLLPATLAAILLVHMVTLASFRFIVPLLPVLYVLASGPLSVMARGIANALRSPLVVTASALIALLVVAAQFQSWPLRVEYAAADLDGLAAANRIDELTGTVTRFADAARGVRPVALLPDTSMPHGSLRITARLRRTTATASDAAVVARVAFIPLRGAACTVDVLAAQLPTDRFSDIAMLCALEQDSPTTLALFTMGADDVAVDSVRLDWR